MYRSLCIEGKRNEIKLWFTFLRSKGEAKHPTNQPHAKTVQITRNYFLG